MFVGACAKGLFAAVSGRRRFGNASDAEKRVPEMSRLRVARWAFVLLAICDQSHAVTLECEITGPGGKLTSQIDTERECTTTDTQYSCRTTGGGTITYRISRMSGQMSFDGEGAAVLHGECERVDNMKPRL